MCRFALYLGQDIPVSNLVTEPETSIIHQSFHSHEREEPLNGDGFGVAWYVPEVQPEPALFKDTTPAWNNANLRNLARVVRSSCILSHVRAASPGLPVMHLNCHPFASGPFAFMHNGDMGNMRALRRPLLDRLSDDAFHTVQGSTDSEHVFALFLDAYQRRAGGESAPGGRLADMAAALVDTIAAVEELRRAAEITDPPATLNLAVTDGHEAVVTRYISHTPAKANSLYVHAGKRYVCEGGVCRMLEPDTERGAVIVASEPLSGDRGWDRVPANHLLTIDADLGVSTRPIELG